MQNIFPQKIHAYNKVVTIFEVDEEIEKGSRIRKIIKITSSIVFVVMFCLSLKLARAQNLNAKGKSRSLFTKLVPNFFSPF